ncbi:DsrE family protein [Neiella marina]|uniref:DsrE family protein n=1 Tax=Neiella holothuriorum TaxID=2870530 RepID=A0ABS7EJG7_9GAMM|nr:DsrE family protein [Neiella holothuriorum]MBW8192435.1 DsrE family protein [Neiella holothuriorum]
MIVIWSTQPAIGNITGRETLDAALAFAAYDQPVTLLFSQLAVRQLLPLPEANLAGAKNIANLLKALPMFDIEAVWVHDKSLQQCQLKTEQLIGEPTLVSDQQIRTLLQEANHVIRI